jgi:hypothetical protein
VPPPQQSEYIFPSLARQKFVCTTSMGKYGSLLGNRGPTAHVVPSGLYEVRMIGFSRTAAKLIEWRRWCWLQRRCLRDKLRQLQLRRRARDATRSAAIYGRLEHDLSTAKR